MPDAWYVGLFLGAQLRCYQAHVNLHQVHELTFGKQRAFMHGK